jgi:3'-5' exoribonuclease
MPDELAVLTVRELKKLDPADYGRPFASLLVVKKLASKTASNGNSFYSLELGDRSGSFTCTVFNDSPVFEALKAAGEGAVVRIEGKVEFYQGRLSPRLAKAVSWRRRRRIPTDSGRNSKDSSPRSGRTNSG